MRIAVSVEFPPQLLRFIQEGDAIDDRAISDGMGRAVQEVTRDHLVRLSGERHTTAQRLGASRSGHLGKAAEAVAEPGALQVADRSATLTIDYPGMSRAFRSVTITPHSSKFLAIPVHAMAYNSSPRDPKFQGLVAVVNGSQGVLMLPQPGSETRYRTRRYKRDTGNQPGRDYDEETTTGSRFGTVMFVLKRSVTQRQDRSLLPSDEQWARAAVEGAKSVVRKKTKQA